MFAEKQDAGFCLTHVELY